ncbi:MAG: aminoacyl-histidine dipeptidase [Burkholderiales bacterium]|nr:aminoacyl-histidine dipeptidase [Burkholderiales bacterium]
MDRDIEKLEPQVVWKYFKELTKIPRPSKKEEKVLAYLISTAKYMNLDYTVTDIGNIIIRKNATDANPDRKKIILQAHMDMVPSKTKESKHNFEIDPIDAYIDGEWVTANETTLGADNGMGVAMALAVLASNDIKHNNIEVLITTDEEAGMSGAFGLKGNELTGEVLLNLDSEDDEEVSIGCAGGVNTNITYDISYEEADIDTSSMRIELKDLFSGHSGCDITLGRANAIKEITSLLTQLKDITDYNLVSMSGGKLRNVIPSYCEAVINVQNNNLSKVKNFITEFKKELLVEFAKTDANMKLEIIEVENTKIVSKLQADKFILALNSTFNGAWRLNNDLGIAETSSNIGVVSFHDNHIKVITMQRSAMHTPKIKLSNMIAAPFKLIGATIEQNGIYPGWQPNIESKSLSVVCQSYRELFGHEIKVGATHGGLECGLIMDKFPNLDAVSIGATIQFPHSPNERVNIASVGKSWKLLVKIINNL